MTRLRHAVVAAREIGHLRERDAVPRLRFIEETRRPQRVAVQRCGVGAVGIRVHQFLGLPAREIEFRYAERR